MWCLVGLGLIGSIGDLFSLVLNGLLSMSHQGKLKYVMLIDVTECTWLVCAQQGIVSRSILTWGILGWPVCHNIVGRVQL